MDYSKFCKGQKLAFQEALNEMVGRRNGTITSYATPWPKVNDAGTDLIASTALTEIGATHSFQKSEGTNRIATG